MGDRRCSIIVQKYCPPALAGMIFALELTLRVAVDQLAGTSRHILTVSIAYKNTRSSRIPPDVKDNHRNHLEPRISVRKRIKTQ